MIKMIKINNDTLNLNSILNALVTSKFAYKDLVDLPEEHNSLDLLSFISVLLRLVLLGFEM